MSFSSGPKDMATACSSWSTISSWRWLLTLRRSSRSATCWVRAVRSALAVSRAVTASERAAETVFSVSAKSVPLSALSFSLTSFICARSRSLAAVTASRWLTASCIRCRIRSSAVVSSRRCSTDCRRPVCCRLICFMAVWKRVCAERASPARWSRSAGQLLEARLIGLLEHYGVGRPPLADEIDRHGRRRHRQPADHGERGGA